MADHCNGVLTFLGVLANECSANLGGRAHDLKELIRGKDARYTLGIIINSCESPSATSLQAAVAKTSDASVADRISWETWETKFFANKTAPGLESLAPAYERAVRVFI